MGLVLWMGQENQQIDVRIGIKFAAAVSTYRDQGYAMAGERVRIP